MPGIRVLFYRNPLVAFIYILSKDLSRCRHYCQRRIKDVGRERKKFVANLKKRTRPPKLAGFAERVVLIPINVKFPKLNSKRNTQVAWSFYI